MPTQQPIADAIIPRQIEPPIPTRTVSTRPQIMQPEIAGQELTNNSPAAESAPPEESVRLSAQVSAIARKEQAYRQRELALKEREKAIEARLSEAEKYDQLKAKMSAKDFSEAESLGLNYEEYTKYVLDKQGGEDPQIAELKALRAKIEALEKGTEESAANQYEETVAEYKKEIARAVSQNPEFSTIKGIEGGQQAVLQLIVDSFEEDGTELSVAEAAQLVEEQLVEKGKRYTSLPKFQTTPEVEPERVLPRPMVGKTLTNEMTTSSEKRPYKSLQHLSEPERYAEARRRVLERLEKGK